MHLLPSAASLLLLGHLTLGAPLLTPRLLPVADRFTCEIAGLQIDDPMRVLAALRQGTSQPPSDLSTDEFTQLLLGCISASGSGSRQHTTNFADPSDDQEDIGNTDPAAFGNSPGYPATANNVATGSPSTADASSAGGASSNPTPAPATDNNQAADPGASNASGDANGDPSAPAAADNDPPPTDDTTSASSTSSSNAVANVDNSAMADEANAAPAPPSNPPADPPAAADPPSDSPTASDSGSSSATSTTADESSPSGPAFNPNQATTANSASGGDNGNSDPASGNEAAADADASGANASSSPFLPFQAYTADSEDDYTNGDDSEFDNPRQHSTSHTSNACEGTLCLADTVLPAGVAEAPELGTNGLANGNAGSCPTGDIDLCLDLGTR